MAIDLVLVAGLATVVAVTALLVFVFSPKEVSYEEAHRSQLLIQNTSKPAAASSTKVNRKDTGHKKDKVQRKASVKKKKDKVNGAPNGLPDDLDSDVPILSVESADDPSTPVDENRSQPDHVEFKSENLIIEFDRESLPERKRRVSTDEKPKKPILLNKTPEPSTPTFDFDEVKPRTNSFDIMHPKDEYELYKSTQLRKSQESLANSGRLTPTVVNGNGFFASDAVPAQVQHHTLAVSPVTRESTDGKIKNKDKSKAKHRVAPLNSLEALTTEKLIETIKSLALDSNEITLLVNELLNKQADGESSWSLKNDPVAPLKKSLAEKETQLKVEIANSEAANARVKELRSELSNERSRTQGALTSLNICKNELANLQATLGQINDKHRSDLAAKTKLTIDQKATINQLQDEIATYKETIKKYENDCEALPRLKIELEKLRQTANSTERRLPVLQAANDELLREKGHLQELLKSLQATKQQEENTSKALQQTVNELKSKLAQVESNAKASLDELNQARSKIIQLESELRSSRERMNDVEANSKDSVAKSNAEINLLKSQSVKLEEELRKSNQNVTQLTSKLNEKDEQIKQLTLQVENKGKEIELENQLKQANEELEKLKENIASDSSAQARVDELTNQLKVVSSEKESLDTALGEAKSTSSKLADEMNNYFKLLSEAYPGVREKIGSGASLSNLISELVKEAEVNANAQQSNEQLESLGHELQGEKEKTRQLQQDLNSLKSSLAKTSEALKAIELKAVQEEQSWLGKISNLTQENEKLKGENEALQSCNGSSSETINNLEGSLSSVKSQLEELQVALNNEQQSKKELTTQLQEASIMCYFTYFVSLAFSIHI